MLQLTGDGQLELQQQLSIPGLALPTALQVYSRFSLCLSQAQASTTFPKLRRMRDC